MKLTNLRKRITTDSQVVSVEYPDSSSAKELRKNRFKALLLYFFFPFSDPSFLPQILTANYVMGKILDPGNVFF